MMMVQNLRINKRRCVLFSTQPKRVRGVWFTVEAKHMRKVCSGKSHQIFNLFFAFMEINRFYWINANRECSWPFPNTFFSDFNFRNQSHRYRIDSLSNEHFCQHKQKQKWFDWDSIWGNRVLLISKRHDFDMIFISVSRSKLIRFPMSKKGNLFAIGDAFHFLLSLASAWIVKAIPALNYRRVCVSRQQKLAAELKTHLWAADANASVM